MEAAKSMVIADQSLSREIKFTFDDHQSPNRSNLDQRGRDQELSPDKNSKTDNSSPLDLDLSHKTSSINQRSNDPSNPSKSWAHKNSLLKKDHRDLELEQPKSEVM